MNSKTNLFAGTIASGWPPNPGPYPDWLPTAPSGDRPHIYADFANDHYWADGAIRTLTELWVENTDYGTFDTANVVAGQGLLTTLGNSSPTVNRSLLSTTLPTYTVVMSAIITDLDSADVVSFEVDAVDLPSFDADSSAIIYYSQIGDKKLLGEFLNYNGDSAFTPSVDGVSPTAAAFNIYTDKAVGSLMGSSITSTAVHAAPAAPTDIGIQSSAIASNTGYLQTVAIYDLQPDADLPTLSTP